MMREERITSGLQEGEVMSTPKIDLDELVEKCPALVYELVGGHRAWERAQRRYNTGEDCWTDDKALLELALFAAETRREARAEALEEAAQRINGCSFLGEYSDLGSELELEAKRIREGGR